MPQILVHVVTYNSWPDITYCVEGILGQHGVTLGSDFQVLITDNCSSDETRDYLQSLNYPGISVALNQNNLGFCGAHNQGAEKLINSRYDYLLICNPDLRLAPDALFNLVNEIKGFKQEKFGAGINIGAFSGKLLRAGPQLQPLSPQVIDSTGIVFTDQLRHFDRGEDELDTGQYEHIQLVSGGTGALLAVSRAFVEAVSFRAAHDQDVLLIYPQLASGREQRPQLFDEAFFAYREDAELALRAQHLGWHYLYLPKVVGYHLRRVTSDRRRSLPAIINRLGVKNRFLLQINSHLIGSNPRAFFLGLIMRNLLVLAAVILKEQTSLVAFSELWKLRRRAWARRRKLKKLIARAK